MANPKGINQYTGKGGAKGAPKMVDWRKKAGVASAATVKAQEKVSSSKRGAARSQASNKKKGLTDFSSRPNAVKDSYAKKRKAAGL